MESLLGLQEEIQMGFDEQEQSSSSLKLVPWLNWDEWVFVKDSLFSNSPDSVSSALNRISAWRSRGCLPIVIEVTASIIEIQQKDPYCRWDASNADSLSEEMLAMLYCMAIVRLVNGTVEKTRKREDASIAVVADAIGIPRMLIDIRHEGSHRELPALKVARDASMKALEWLKSYYWEPQSKSIPFQGEKKLNIRKEVKSKLRHLALLLKMKETLHSSSFQLKGKRSRHGKLLCGRNKLLSLVAGKNHASTYGGTKKQITKTLKYIIQCYTTFSSEIVSMLLEYLLKASRSSEFLEGAGDALVDPSIQDALAEWKPVILILSKKEPDLLVTLLREVLDMIESQEAKEHEKGMQQLAQMSQIEHLSSLFAWLVEYISTVKKTRCTDPASKVNLAEADVPKEIQVELLRRCLLVSAPGNRPLIDSAARLAQLLGDSSLRQKLDKFYSLILMSANAAGEENPPALNAKNNILEDEAICQAAKKLELVRQHIRKRKSPPTMDGSLEKSKNWVLAKSWKPCPIGMLPRAVGSLGHLPVLDNSAVKMRNATIKCLEANRKDALPVDHDVNGKDLLPMECDVNDISPHNYDENGKDALPAECDANDNVILSMEGYSGRVMIGGVWKRVTEDELHEIQSAVQILVDANRT